MMKEDQRRELSEHLRRWQRTLYEDAKGQDPGEVVPNWQTVERIVCTTLMGEDAQTEALAQLRPMMEEWLAQFDGEPFYRPFVENFWTPIQDFIINQNSPEREAPAGQKEEENTMCNIGPTFQTWREAAAQLVENFERDYNECRGTPDPRTVEKNWDAIDMEIRDTLSDWSEDVAEYDPDDPDTPAFEEAQALAFEEIAWETFGWLFECAEQIDPEDEEDDVAQYIRDFWEGYEPPKFLNVARRLSEDKDKPAARKMADAAASWYEGVTAADLLTAIPSSVEDFSGLDLYLFKGDLRKAGLSFYSAPNDVLVARAEIFRMAREAEDEMRRHAALAMTPESIEDRGFHNGAVTALRDLLKNNGYAELTKTHFAKPEKAEEGKKEYFPASRSLTPAELEEGEEALRHLLWSYREYILKKDLRCLLSPEDKPGGFYVDNHNLMEPAQLYKLIDAADTLVSFLADQKIASLKKRKKAGDISAAELLRDLGVS